MDAQQFESIYRSNYAMLRQAANNLIRDADAAHDLVQEVFVRLWNKREELYTVLNPSAYLYKSVVNASLNYLEQGKRKKMTAEPLHLSSADTSDGAVELKELQKRISAAIERLPPKCRMIFILSRVEEKKNREIAAILDLSLKTVENQMGIALKKLREELKPYLDSGWYTPASLAALAFLAGLCSLG